MFTLQDLPTLNASLNATSAVLLSFGYFFIRRRRISAHRVCMISAFVVSILFLASYLIYHSQVGSKPFPGVGWIRSVYFAILIPHSVLAAAVPVLAIVTLYRALRARFAKHVRVARWTLPIWLFVSVTGVLVYLMLYRLYPHA